MNDNENISLLEFEIGVENISDGTSESVII